MSTQDTPLLARQPILDTHQTVVGYELLCRPAPEDTLTWQVSHGDRATSEVMISAFNDLGIDEVTGGLPAFVNFTEHWLQNPPILPATNLVAEVLEHIHPTDANLKALRTLRKLGYRIALDDYQGEIIHEPLLPLVDIIKVDIRRLGNLDSLPGLISRYQRDGLTWLAEKVETQEEFKICRDAGCELFQGYFFSRPANVYGKRLPDNQLAVLQLIRLLNDPDAEFDDIASALQSDPQLSYKLLRIVNSAAVGCAREVTSIHRAIVIVGLSRLKAWANLISLGKLSDKPPVLREQAVVRAYLCQALTFAWPHLDDDTAFTIGLFSLLDAFLDFPLDAICERLSMPEPLTLALTRQEGDYGFILKTVIAMEQADWDSIDWNVLAGMGVTPADLEFQYLKALHITRELLRSEAG
ncbi:EAL and HDOD domain-containing protein [Thalassolituus sp. LLYu03]|uniref:EAL and HDOD domain-containing protein n=1 Tax=Thalassolituus sp. LLYu03 TaxID=3421656 RepID=UPI003D265F52